MQTTVGHIQINVAQGNLQFYRDLAELLGLATIWGDDTMLGVGTSNGPSLWFAAAPKAVANDYDGPGMNHLGLGAASIADVDAVVAWLCARNIGRLFDTPCHRPEFAGGPDNTYYQVMFETPDRVLLEVVYTGPR